MSWGALAGGVIGGLMGGRGGGSTSTNEPWDVYQTPLRSMSHDLWRSIGERGYYPGDMVSDLTFETQYGNNLTTGAADELTGFNRNLGSTMGMYLDPSFMDPNNSPWMNDYIGAATRPVTEQFTENVLPSIRSGSRMTGGSDYGSTRQGVAEGIATRGYLDTVGDISTNMWGNLYGTNLNAQQRAMGMSPMYAQMMGVPGAMYQGVGDRLQLQDQAEIDANVNKYNWERDLPIEDTYRLMSLMHGAPYGSQTQSGGSGGQLTGALGGMMMGNSIMDMFNDDIPWADDWVSDDSSVWG